MHIVNLCDLVVLLKASRWGDVLTSPPAFGPNISEWLPCTVCSPFFQCPLALVILFLLQTCIRAPKITLYIFSEIICMPNLFFFIKKIIHDAPHTVATVCQVVEIDCDVCNFYLKLSCKIHIVHLIIFQIVQLTWSCFVHHIFHIVQLISLHFPYICNFEITTLICLTP